MHRIAILTLGLMAATACTTVPPSVPEEPEERVEIPEVEAPDLLMSITKGISEDSPLFASLYTGHWPEDQPNFSIYDMPKTLVLDQSKTGGALNVCAFFFQVLESKEDFWAAEVAPYQRLGTVPERISYLVPEELLPYTQYRVAFGTCGGIGSPDFLNMQHWEDSGDLVAGGYLRTVVDDGTMNFHICETVFNGHPEFTARCP